MGSRSALSVFLCVLCAFVVNVFSPSRAIAAERKPSEPLSPREALATFKLLPGFKAELVAAEPDVIDPVSMCFDERGRMFVCEMIGYPNGGVATGQENRGRIRMLTDEDGDGVFEKSVVFADGLRFPTGVTPWRGGIIATVAPDILFLEDTDGDGKADKKKVLYTGFGLNNIQQIVNSPQFGLDNWVYALVGSTGGDITCPDKPDMKPLVLRGRGVRFNPDVPGSIEPTSGGGQYGLARDEFQHWFTNTNSQHLKQIVLPDHYLRRNPYLAVPATTLDIPDHGAACKLFRISPFESWRVERTTRRKDSPEAKRFAPNELVPGGFVTSGCGAAVCTDPVFPKEFHNNTFMCDPANNLIHRDILEVKGSVFTAKRGDADCEFLASTDNWFRPVYLTFGPDGALYVCDFYREAIETPLSLPEDLKARMNLESRQKGRIWRIVPESFKATKLPDIGIMPLDDKVAMLDDPILTNRLTAQRLLLTSDHPRKVAHIDPVRESRGLIHRLWLMKALGLPWLREEIVELALSSAIPGVREHGLRLAEPHLANSARIQRAVLKLLDDESPHVRLQLAFTLGAMPANVAGPALAKLLTRPDVDAWLQSAVLSSAPESAPALLRALLSEPSKAGTAIARLATMIGAKGDDTEIGAVLNFLPTAKGYEAALLDGLGQGMQNSKRPLGLLLAKPPESIRDAIAKVQDLFVKAAATSRDEKADLKARVAAMHLLAYAPAEQGVPVFAELLSAHQPLEVQTAAVRGLAAANSREALAALIDAWKNAGPALRGELVETLVARMDRIEKLLDAIEANKISAGQIDSVRVQFLKSYQHAKIRARANKLFAGLGNTDRKLAVDNYRDALALKADPIKGKALFAKNCAACHRLENVGNDVGANLMAALPNKSREALLIDILDPSREVDTRFVNYRVTTQNGQTFTGILAVESPSSITLRRAEKAEDTILRNQIDEMTATPKSLMPEEFEKQMGKQDVADLIEYLKTVGK